ncbi:LysE family translocator [Stenotrophomonas sp. PD6]|uniref:LysE family translocator n=1 Tax=Stenotrophomonas sp. PD6 TaxID=3368612 RepID=UPI003BA2C02C
MVVTYILTVTLLIATPGPVVALVINTASTAGPRKALSTAIGTNLSSLALIAIASYIVLTSAAISPVFLGIFGLLGCLFIGYLAFDALAARPDPELIESRTGSSMHGGLWRGVLLGISNPKDIIFFIAFFPQFIHATPSPEHSLLLLSLLWVVIDFLILGAYILVTKKMESYLSQRLISRCSGAALLLVALLGTIYNTRDLLRVLSLN